MSHAFYFNVLFLFALLPHLVIENLFLVIFYHFILILPFLHKKIKIKKKEYYKI